MWYARRAAELDGVNDGERTARRYWVARNDQRLEHVVLAESVRYGRGTVGVESRVANVQVLKRLIRLDHVRQHFAALEVEAIERNVAHLQSDILLRKFSFCR